MIHSLKYRHELQFILCLKQAVLAPLWLTYAAFPCLIWVSTSVSIYMWHTIRGSVISLFEVKNKLQKICTNITCKHINIYAFKGFLNISKSIKIEQLKKNKACVTFPEKICKLFIFLLNPLIKHQLLRHISKWKMLRGCT